MNAKNQRHPFRGMRAPRAPADLEQRALRAATDALELGDPETIWDRIWESRLFGRAWVTLTLGLLVAHVGLSLVSKAPDAAGQLRSVELRQVREMRKLLKLPVVEISPRAAKIALGARSSSKRSEPADGSGPASRS